jgi:hypothetical protein
MDTTLPRLSEYTADKVLLGRANDYVKFVSCLVQCQNRVQAAAEDFALKFPRSVNLDLVMKAGVTPGTTYEPGWSPLAPLRLLQEAFITLARPQALLAKLDALVRHVPTNVSVPVQTGGATYAWVGQGAPKPIGNMQLQSVTLPPATAAGILITSSELMKVATAASVATVRADLGRGLAFYLDQQLTDPAVSAVTNVSPGSITTQAPSFGSSGTSAANCLTDLKKLYALFFAANQDAVSAVVFMSPANAAAAASATGWQALGADGGSLSEAAASSLERSAGRAEGPASAPCR